MARSKALLNVLAMTNSEGEPIEQAFLRDLQRSITLTDEKNTRKASQTVKPSSLACMRSVICQLLGIEPLPSNASSELVGICENGTDRHERIQTAISHMIDNGMDCKYCDAAEYVKENGLEDTLEIREQNGMETKLYHKELNISFMCDGIVRYKGKYFILEIKTEGQNAFWNQNGVMPKHFYQGIAYSLCFGISDVVFLYESRDTLRKKTFLFHVSDEQRAELKARIENCLQLAKEKKFPPKEADVKCEWCGFRELCKSVGDMGVDISGYAKD